MHNPTGIYDEAGRYLAPTPIETFCAWCPDFDPTDPRNAGASHGMCEACGAKIEAQLEALLDAPRQAA